MGGTQPYSSPDLVADKKKDPALEPVAAEEAERLTVGAQQQAGQTEQLATEAQPEQGSDDRSPALAADTQGEIPSAAEAEDRGRADQGRSDDN